MKGEGEGPKPVVPQRCWTCQKIGTRVVQVVDDDSGKTEWWWACYEH